MLDALEKSLGVVTAACKTVGVGRTTHYLWMDTDPEYKAALRDASQQAAGAGQIGSGMARGRLGDIGLARTRDLQSAQTGFLNDATNNSIEDLSDVASMTKNYGDLLFWNGTTWSDIATSSLGLTVDTGAVIYNVGDQWDPIFLMPQKIEMPAPPRQNGLSETTFYHMRVGGMMVADARRMRYIVGM